MVSGSDQDPGLPGSKPCAAYWQSPASLIASHQSTVFPKHATIAIIGSGITGASVAHHLLQHSPDLDIVMLEARTVTSGATGRNGGHCKDVSFKTYKQWKSVFGKAAAHRLVKFRGSHVESTRELAQQLQREGFTDAQFRDVESVTAVFEPAAYKELVANLDDWLQDYPDDKGQFTSMSGEDAERKYGILGACGVLTSPAGALWPYRLVTGVLERLLRLHKNFSLETHTPVTAITASGNPSRPYAIRTDRGVIEAQHVIHCTNGHAAHLLPKFRGKIVPVRGQMTSLEPPDSFPRLGHTRSWSLIWPNAGFDYMTQAAGPEGHVFLGGGVEQAAERGVVDFNSVADHKVNQPAVDHLCSVLPRYFRGGVGTKLHQAWTGIMGFTPDAFPIVGKLSDDMGSVDSPAWTVGGEWIAAGFNGYGMVHCWQSGRALAEMVTGKDDTELAEWFPVEQFGCSAERLRNMDYNSLKATFYKNAAKQTLNHL